VNLKDTVASAWQLPDLRARIIFLFAMFAVYSLGLHVPVPGLTPAQVDSFIGNNAMMGLIDLFSGGALRKVSIFALGLNPYITASIIMQLMSIAIPSLHQMQREGGDYAKRKINEYTRKLTVVLAILQGAGIAISILRSAGAATPFLTVSILVISWTAGAMFLLWLGEQMTEKGIGNGISLLIFAGIVSRLPYYIGQTADFLRNGAVSPFGVTLLVVIFIGTIWSIVMFTRAQRRIPIQHARRIIGQRAVGGQTTYLPLSLNSAGVIPIIFAISLLMLPQQFANMVPQGGFFSNLLSNFAKWFTPGTSQLPLYYAWIPSFLYALMIFAFTYFYTAVIYNVEEIADNLKKHGAFIPGIRPGKPTQEYLDKVVTRVTAAGATFLAVIALLQYWVPDITGVSTFWLVGGTSMLIVVGVALDTMQQIESQLLMRQYEGFIK